MDKVHYCFFMISLIRIGKMYQNVVHLSKKKIKSFDETGYWYIISEIKII